MLEGAAALLADPVPFDPGTARRTLRIAALDFEVSLLSGTARAVRRAAPGLALHFRALGRDTAVQALERDEVNLWIGFTRGLPSTLETAALFEEGYEVIARRGHPRVADEPGSLDLDAYCAETHVVAAPGGTTGGIVDKTLHRAGRARRVGVTTTGFLSALDLVAHSDMIATVPARLARMQAGTFRLIVRAPPIAPRPFRVSATWHRRAARDPAVAWFVKTLGDSLD